MTDVPQWRLLPEHAEEFFDLQPGYTRSDLKRSYNRILRRYKPEQFPEEFQLLRAAFEELEEALRFGIQSQSPSGSPPAAESPSDSATEGAAVERLPMCERLEALGAVALLAELEKQATRTPSEWVTLALLRETAENALPLALHKTLMQGVIASHGDDLVVNTLLGACRDPLPVRDAGRLVQALARWIQEHSPDAAGWYYFASTPLWLSLVRKVPFETFKTLLNNCRQRIGIDGNAGYLTLTLRLLRTGALVADSEWVGTAMEDLYESYEDLPGDLREEVDILEWLHSYMAQRDTFLGQHPAREAWDAALVAILSEEEPAADRAFLVATSAALDDPDSLLAAFPPGAENVACALTPLYAFSEDSFARSKEPEPIRNPDQIQSAIVPFMFRLEKVSERTTPGKVDDLIGYAIFALIVLAAALPKALFGSLLPAGWMGGITIACVILAFVGGRRLSGWLYNKHMGPMYQKVWRGQVREFLEAHPMHVHELVAGLENLGEKGITNHYRLASQLSSDPGMLLYALSLRFA